MIATIVLDKISSARLEETAGIFDLDEILQGGIPSGNSLLISGASGTGKTTTCLEILCRGAAAGETGVIYLTSETPDRAISNLGPFKFYESSFVDDGKLVIEDMNALFQKLGIEHPDTGLSRDDGQKLLDALAKAVDDAKASRLAIDSLSGVLVAFEDEGRVRTFMKDLVRTFTAKGISLFLTSEIAPDSVRYSTMGIEDTLVDGVILLSNVESRGDLLRSLQIIKMRGTDHSRSRFVMDLTPYGIIIVPVLKSYTKGGGD
jgi:KaiC/GvpD/RAD55 family RecA-like ATPase